MKPSSLVPSALFGVLAGIDGLGNSLAFAAVLFSGGLAAGFGMGVSVTLLSGIVLALFVALRSGYPSSVGLVQEIGIAILASSVAAATGAMVGQSADARIATVFAILGVSTLATGALFWLFGRFRFGALVRFLPYPVIAGFLAGSGFLLIQGGLLILSGSGGMLATFTSVTGIFQLVITLVFAGILVTGLRVSHSPAVPPAIMVLSVSLFYLVLNLSGMSNEAARAAHWLPMAQGGGLVMPSPIWIVSAADWSAVLSVLPALLSIPILSMAGLLLNTSGIEMAAGRDIDANRELRITGQANLLSGLFGGASGFTGLGLTLLADKFGSKGRATGIATAIVLALAFPWAADLAAGVPVFMAAGLMLVLGGQMAWDWGIASRRQMAPLEWAVVLAIPLSIMLFGFMAGMGVGLAFSVVTFVYNYARLPVIRLAASGREKRSSVDRSAEASRILFQDGHLVHTIELQGYLFFGTVEQVVRAVRRRLGEKGLPLRYLVLDFRKVSGMDAAAAAGFVKIRNMMSGEGMEVLLCSVTEPLHDAFSRTSLLADRGVIEISDLDHALERCEDRLLANHAEFHEPVNVVEHLERTLGRHDRLRDLVSAMERMELEAGEALITTGQKAGDVFLLGEGRVKVQVPLGGGRAMRLRTMTSGAVLGEVAFYLGGKRTADVLVEQPSVLYRMGREELLRLEREDSGLAVLAHKLFAVALAERLSVANRMLQVTMA